jgi:hypothetical protein
MPETISKNTLYKLNRIDDASSIVIYSDGSGAVKNKNGGIVFYFTNIIELNNALNSNDGKYHSHYHRDKRHGTQ